MVLRSTAASIQAKKISILALIETVLAIGVALAIAAIFDTFAHIAIAAILAPFLLLQTPQSKERTLKFVGATAHSSMNALEKSFPANRVATLVKATKQKHVAIQFLTVLMVESYLAIVSIMIWFVLLIKCIIVRPFIVLMVALQHPLVALATIPENWRLTVLCVDSASIPEIVPGISTYPPAKAYLPLSLQDFFNAPRNSFAARHTIVAAILVSPIWLTFLYLPGVTYRWSLKSTAAIWSPLLWAFRPLTKDEDAIHFARGIVRLTKYRIARAYSFIVIGLFATKIAIWLAWSEVATHLAPIPVWPILEQYVTPRSFPVWQITALINAGLTWGIFFKSEQFLHDLRGTKRPDPKRMKRFFRVTFAARNLLTIYTIICTVYLTVRMASTLQFPALEFVVFPWNWARN